MLAVLVLVPACKTQALFLDVESSIKFKISRGPSRILSTLEGTKERNSAALPWQTQPLNMHRAARSMHVSCKWCEILLPLFLPGQCRLVLVLDCAKIIWYTTGSKNKASRLRMFSRSRRPIVLDCDGSRSLCLLCQAKTLNKRLCFNQCAKITRWKCHARYTLEIIHSS